MNKEVEIITIDEKSSNELVFSLGDLAVCLLSCINPGIGLIAGVTLGSGKILKIWNDKLNDRNEESKKYVKRDDLSELADTPELRDKILTLAQKLWEEPIKEKRALYYGYINNLNTLDQNKVDFTKLMSSIANLDVYDIEILMLFSEKYDTMVKDFAIDSLRKQNNNVIPDISKINYRPWFVDGIPSERVHSHISDPSGEGDVYEPHDLNDNLNTLSHFGTISIAHGFTDGSHYGPVSQLGQEIIKYFKEYKEQ